MLLITKEKIRDIKLILYFSLIFSFIFVKRKISSFFSSLKKLIIFLYKRKFEKPSLQIDRQTVIVNHIYVVYPNIEKFLENAFLLFQIKDFLVVKNSNIGQLNFESKEFKLIAEKYFQVLRRILGKRTYEEIENYWGKEEFEEFVMIWLFYRISKDLANNIRNLIS